MSGVCAQDDNDCRYDRLLRYHDLLLEKAKACKKQYPRRVWLRHLSHIASRGKQLLKFLGSSNDWDNCMGKNAGGKSRFERQRMIAIKTGMTIG